MTWETRVIAIVTSLRRRLEKLPALVERSEAAEAVGLSAKTLRRMELRGELQGVRINARSVLFSNDELVAAFCNE